MRTVRPYRSHKYPACTRCRQRRTRCTIETPGKACVLCRVSDSKCSAEKFAASRSAQEDPPPKVDSISPARDVRIVGPVVARDTDVLNALVPGIERSVLSDAASPSILVPTSKHQIYHVENPARRPSPPGCTCSTRSFSSLWNQVEPVLERLVDIYLQKLHVCLPLLDDKTFRAMIASTKPLSSSLSTNLVAYAAFYWNHSPQNVQRASINMDLAWLVALIASDRESQRADAMSIVSIILIISGRPSKGVVHNTGNIARAAAFAQSIGLNHDCTDWSLGPAEKSTRCKIWWAVLIHDRWFNFAHGTPPAINQDHYNVALPNLAMLLSDFELSAERKQASECYIELCKLTEITGEILPLLHRIRPGHRANVRETRQRANQQLESWKDNLPMWINISEMDNRMLVPGLPNLQLSYLAVRMLLSRLAWHESLDLSADDLARSPDLLLMDCLYAAAQVTKFVQSLRHQEIFGFWLPYNAQHFTSAVILLLRCAVQAHDSDTRFRAMTSAQQLVASLTYYHESIKWDMADSILGHCKRMFDKVELALRGRAIQPQSPQKGNQSANRFSLSSTPAMNNTLPQDCVIDFQFNESIEDLFPELFSSLAAESEYLQLQYT